MELKSLKILVRDYVIMGKVIKPSNPESITKYPLFKGVFEVLNIVFIGSNILARPPTFNTTNTPFFNTNLRANYF